MLTLAALGGPGTAYAAGEKLDPGKFAKRLSGVPFQKDLKALLVYMQSALDREYRVPIREAKDPHQRDRLRAEIGLRLQQLKDSYVEFKGQKTGYNVSIVSREFAHNTGESMVVLAVGHDHDYFFFLKGKLWKHLTSLETTKPFSEFLLELTRVYGPPDSVAYRHPDTKQNPFEAVWTSPSRVLQIRSRDDYGSITLTWADRSVADKVVTLRGANRPPGEGHAGGLDPTIIDIMKD